MYILAGDARSSESEAAGEGTGLGGGAEGQEADGAPPAPGLFLAGQPLCLLQAPGHSQTV